MKQIDYVVHRPLTEAKGSTKQLEKRIASAVDGLPSNPTWYDIRDAYEQVKEFESTKSSWNGGFSIGTSFSGNFFARVARKYGLKKIWMNDGKRPTVVKPDGDTAAFFDPTDSDKEEAERQNEMGMLSPAAAAMYEIPHNKGNKPKEEPEAEPEEPEELPDAGLPTVKKDTQQKAQPASIQRPIPREEEDGDCPEYYLDEDGEEFKIKWALYGPNGKIADGHVSDKSFSHAEADEIVAKLRQNSKNCGATDKASAEEAVNNAITVSGLSGLGMIGAAGMVGKKKPPINIPKNAGPQRTKINWDGVDPKKNQGIDAKRQGPKNKLTHTSDPYPEKKVATSPDGKKARLKPGDSGPRYTGDEGRAKADDVKKRLAPGDSGPRYTGDEGRAKANDVKRTTKKRLKPGVSPRYSDTTGRVNASDVRKVNGRKRLKPGASPKYSDSIGRANANDVRRTNRKAKLGALTKNAANAAGSHQKLHQPRKVASPIKRTVPKHIDDGGNTGYGEKSKTKPKANAPNIRDPELDNWKKHEVGKKATIAKDRLPARQGVGGNGPRYDDQPGTVVDPDELRQENPAKKLKKAITRPRPLPDRIPSITSNELPKPKPNKPTINLKNPKPTAPKIPTTPEFGKPANRNVSFDFDFERPSDGLKKIDPNNLPDIPEIKRNSQHKLMLGILDTLDDPPRGVNDYLKNLRLQMKGVVKPKLLNDITDLSKIYVGKIKNNLPEPKKVQLKQLAAGLISQNTAISDFTDELKNFKIDFADTQLPKPITDLPSLPNEPLKSGPIDLERYRTSPVKLQGDDLVSYLNQNKITKKNIPFELADPDVVKTSDLLQAFDIPKSTFAKTITTDTGQEALERLAKNQIKPSEFLQSLEVDWKDKKSFNVAVNAMQGSQLDVDTIERAFRKAIPAPGFIDGSSSKVSTDDLPSELKPSDKLTVPNETPDPAPEIDTTTVSEPANRKVPIDFNIEQPERVLQNIDVNNMPEVPANVIKHTPQHKNMLGILDGLTDPPGGDVVAYRKQLKQQLLDAGINAAALDKITDLSDLYLDKVGSGLPPKKLNQLKQITAGLISQNTTFSPFIDGLKDFEIQANNNLPGANANANLGSIKNIALQDGPIDWEGMRSSRGTLTTDELRQFIDKNNFTKSNIPVELLDPKIVATDNLFQAFNMPKSNLLQSLQTDVGQESLGRIAQKQIKPQEFVQALEVKWKDQNAIKYAANAMQGSTLDLTKLDAAFRKARIATPDPQPEFKRDLEPEPRNIDPEAERTSGMSGEDPTSKFDPKTTQPEPQNIDPEAERTSGMSGEDPLTKIDGPKQLTPEPSTPAAEVQAQADKLAKLNQQGPTANTSQITQKDGKPQTSPAGSMDMSQSTAAMGDVEGPKMQQALADLGVTGAAPGAADIEPGGGSTDVKDMPEPVKRPMDPGAATMPGTQTDMNVAGHKFKQFNLKINTDIFKEFDEHLQKSAELEQKRSFMEDPKNKALSLVTPEMEDNLAKQIDELKKVEGINPTVIAKAEKIQASIQQSKKPTPGGKYNTMPLELERELDSLTKDLADMKANGYKRTSLQATDFEGFKKQLSPALQAKANELGLDSVEDLKRLQKLNDPANTRKQQQEALNKAKQQMKEILEGNNPSNEGKYKQEKMQGFIDANGGSIDSAAKAFIDKASVAKPEEMNKLIRKLGGRQLASKLGAGAIKTGAKISAVAATGGVAALVIFLDLLDIYDVATILIMMGLIDDPNNTIYAKREEDLKLVNDYLSRTDVSDDQKKAYMQKMLHYETVSAWNPKWWMGGLENLRRNITGDKHYKNLWNDTNFIDEWGQVNVPTVTTPTKDPETGLPTNEEQPLTPFNINQFDSIRDVSKEARTIGDIEALHDTVESIYKGWKSGPFVWLEPVGENNFRIMIASSVDDIRQVSNFDDLGGQSQLVSINDIDDGFGNRSFRDSKEFVPGTFDHNLQREIRKYTKGRGHFLTDNVEEILQHITDPTDRRTFDKIMNGNIIDVVPVTIQMAKYQAKQSEKKWNAVQKINPDNFEKQRADALAKQFSRQIDLGHYNESKEKYLMYKMKLLQEQLNTYKNAKYFIIGS